MLTVLTGLIHIKIPHVLWYFHNLDSTGYLRYAYRFRGLHITITYSLNIWI